MCVIIYKSKKAKMPSPEIIRECWRANPDGAGMCHPFPLTGEKGDLPRGFFDSEDDGLIMHNGVLFQPQGTSLSDTALLALHLGRNPRDTNKLLDKYSCNNRFVIFHPKKRTILKGDWYELDGLMFSNMRWYRHNVKYHSNERWV